jgi:tRNA-binding protein
MEAASFDDFQKIDMRVGRVSRVEEFPEARKPAWRIWIDFGPEVGESARRPRSPTTRGTSWRDG